MRRSGSELSRGVGSAVARGCSAVSSVSEALLGIRPFDADQRGRETRGNVPAKPPAGTTADRNDESGGFSGRPGAENPDFANVARATPARRPAYPTHQPV